MINFLLVIFYILINIFISDIIFGMFIKLGEVLRSGTKRFSGKRGARF